MWPNQKLLMIFTISSFCLQFLVPALSACLIYSQIIWSTRVHVARRGQDEATHFPSQSEIRQLERRRKTNLVLVMVSLFFFLCWAPLNILNLILDVYGDWPVTSTAI